MPGVAGRSGGHNRLSVAAHAVRGTFRPSRHALAVAPAGGAGQPSRATPPRALLADLGPAGRRFVRAAWQDYMFTALEIEVLGVAARAADDEARAREAGDAKGARAAVRQLLAALQRLGLPLVDRTRE